MKSMTIQETQNQIDHWIKNTGIRYFDIMTNMAILSEEVGEVARVIARQYGEQSVKENENNLNLADELADVLFVVFCIANQCNINLSEAIQNNLKKKTQRDAGRHKNNPKLY